MGFYSEILLTTTKIASYADSTEELWQHLQFTGSRRFDFLNEYKQLSEQLVALGFSTVLSVHVNNTPLDGDDIEDYLDNPTSIRNWEVRLNKLPMINRVHDDGWHYNFFLTADKCERWIKTLQPLVSTCPINQYAMLRVWVGDLQDSFGGKTIQFLSPADRECKVPDVLFHQLPVSDRLKESIHFITTDDILIKPSNWQIVFQRDSSLEQALKYKACVVLATCLVNEFYTSEKVIIDGIRRIVLKISDGNETTTNTVYSQLQEVVAWIFEDRVSIRKKLFNERLSLDLESDDTLLGSLIKCLPSALSQAKERYNFVIIDRKDAYVKELKELLKDIRTQSELYAGKIRSLLSNFLRDLLAALVLIGFTIFTKFTDQEALADNNRLRLVFNALAIYFIASIVLQSIIDCTDILVSKREMFYWKNATKELLPEKDFTKHIENSLKGRRYALRAIYPVVAIFYGGIAAVCFYFPEIYDCWIRK